MRTRSQSKQSQSTGEEDVVKHVHVSENNETLSNISRDGVGKLLNIVRRSFNKEDVVYLCHSEATANPERGTKEHNELLLDNTGGEDRVNPAAFNIDAVEHTSSEVKIQSARCEDSNLEREHDDSNSFNKDAVQHASLDVKVQSDTCEDSKLEEDCDGSDWEDGFIPTSSSPLDYREELVSGVLVDFDVSPGLVKRKPGRRVTAAEKEVAEIVHKVHLLCLLGRGRLIDNACNDSLVQASLLSLLPTHFLNISESPKLTATHLCPLVNWFHNNFNVSSSNVFEKPFHLALASTLETREGTPEEVAALSVALFRSLNLITRFVSVLDVTSLKPDIDKSECSFEVNKGQHDIFKSSTIMVAGPSSLPLVNVKSSSEVKESSQIPLSSTVISKASTPRKHRIQSKESQITDKVEDKMSDELLYDVSNNISEPCDGKSEGLKRKGDLEFQMHLEMALSATAIGSSKNSMRYDALKSSSTSSTITAPFRRLKKIKIAESETSSSRMSTAIGSRKVGAPLYWAEVFCSGDNLEGKWVHIDAVSAIIDGESNVEAAVAACKKSLRYVVAFAGNGAKDVTRRYCTKWYKVASQRIDSTWWDSVLTRLKHLESRTTGSNANFEQKTSGDEKIEPSLLINLNLGCVPNSSKLYEAPEEYGDKQALEASKKYTFDSRRSFLEDMELETRALTEPLPTNQLAYKNHHLYAIERWLKKYQIIYPKGPVLGFCSGHAVYPRTCVQTLLTRQMWLREGLQVKADEIPAKVLKHSAKHHKGEAVEGNEYACSENEKTVDLYGKWQTESFHLHRAVNGIVPKNERGQVEVWSEKCLPPGTVHLGFPKIASVAKRLGIDFAPAMVGFESRSARSFPVFEGIVICKEFKDALLEAYAEEEERRDSEEKRRNEAQALSRWYQLLSSIITRQRLKSRYVDGATAQESNAIPEGGSCGKLAVGRAEEREEPQHCRDQLKSPVKHDVPPCENHKHKFILDEQGYGEDGSSRMKRCHCGFYVEFEEL